MPSDRPLRSDAAFDLAALIHDAELEVANENDGYKLSSRQWSEGILAALYELRDIRASNPYIVTEGPWTA